MQDLEGRLLQLIIGHGSIGGAKIHSLGDQLPDSAARAYRLVIHFDFRIDLLVGVKPFRVDGSREGRAGSLELNSPPLGGYKACNSQAERHNEQWLFHFNAIPP